MTDLTFKLKFLVIPDFVYSDSRLNATDIKVFSFINSYKGDKFYFTNSQLGKMFNCSIDSISRSITRLTKFKYIEVDYEIKTGGGKIRFVRHSKVAESETATLRIEKQQSPVVKDNKVKDNINTIDDVAKANHLVNSNSNNKCPNLGEGHKGCIEFIDSFAESRHIKFPNYGKQIKALHMLLKSGYSFDEINQTIDYLEADRFWSTRGFDLMNVVNEIGKGAHVSKN